MRCHDLLPVAFSLLTLPLAVAAQSLEVGPGDNLGAIAQSAAIDDFKMLGGTVQSLNQGEGYDTFYMSGGRIVGAFEDGDYAIFAGGRIGRVDLKLADNYFEMSQDAGVETLIDGNLVSGFGNDTIILRGGTIGGNISTSGGRDSITISGGMLNGNVLASAGNDTLNWSGGTIGGRVDMGLGDDQVSISNLTSQTLNITLDGNAGNDRLDFINSTFEGGARYLNFEAIELQQGSRLTLDDTLVLGDADSGTGTLVVDDTSALVSRLGTVAPLISERQTSVRNAGTIDLSAGQDAQGRLNIIGNYQGDNGLLRVNSVLAGDDAASDRLVVSRGSITGSTLLQVNNLAGTGAATQQNGILVVEARDAATSSATAFVQTQTLSAGAYDYRLFKGGVTAGSENSWYLRSTLVTVPAQDPVEPSQPSQPSKPSFPTEPEVEPAVTPPVAAPAPGQAELPAPIASTSLPLYRPEVPVYAAASRGAAVIARQALGTFHQRQGDQRLMNGQGALPASWGQAYAQGLRQGWSGTVSPSLDGDLYGFKVGQDLYATASDSGYRRHLGLYVGHSRLDADVKGFALAEDGRSVGDLRLTGDSVGAYWTLIDPRGAYIDAVLQYTHLEGRARSNRGDRLNIDGHAWSASMEAGYPLRVAERWTLEPQAQLIAQKVLLDSASDSVSRVSHDAQVEITGRLGVRLEGAYHTANGRLLQPYVQFDVWHSDGGRDTLTFDNVDSIKTDYRSSSLRVESGLVAQISSALSMHAGVHYASNLDSRQQQASGVNLGVRWEF
ncbi:autotransporter outer membrane beta-barrel domain-containing protein [Pseudomonas promysalinigenes]|uniref:autotransporter family protein n=1 Tax=Pseudomonas promysalinigenes TaxID=485898 RepID=UPI0039172972